MSSVKHRLHALCPYFAMFPHTFVRKYLFALTRAGDVILDPFSGRGTTLLESLLLDRKALAVDINPVAACVTGAKAHVPALLAIESRLNELKRHCKETSWQAVDEERRTLPSFFAHAFHYSTLRELLFIRRHLDWRHSDIDRFIAALALGSLHGEMDKSSSYFSNQMPRTISTKPAYSIRYWREHGLRPKRRRVFEILRNRARFRLQDGRPSHRGIALQADVRETSRLLERWQGRVQAIITSPPYLNVTNFEEDQWLRLWFLGGPPWPTYGRISKNDRHSSAKGYWRFLSEAWQGVAGLLAKGGFIVCRVGGKRQSLDALARGMVATVRSAFPSAELMFGPFASSPVQRQTDNFRPGTAGCGVEADFVFHL
jgi:DNA methylase